MAVKVLKEPTQCQQNKWYINVGDEIWFLVIYISKRINLNRKLNSGRVKWIKICLIYNQMKERKSKTLLLATSKQIREAAWQDGHQRTKCFETSNVMLLLLILWHGDFSLENFFQDCFPSFLPYFVYVSLTPRHPPPHPITIFLLLLGPANAPTPLDFPLPHTAVNRLKYFRPAQYQIPWQHSPVWSDMSSITFLKQIIINPS